MAWGHQWNPFPTKFSLHTLRLIKAEQPVLVVDQNVEMGENVLSQDAADVRICRLNRAQVLNHCERFRHQV